MQPITPSYSIRCEQKDHQYLSKWSPASPWPDTEISFHWTNFDYPWSHIHEYWELLIIISGSVHHTINGKSTFLRKHQACLLRPTDCHSFCVADESPLIVLNFMIKKEYSAQLLGAYGAELTDRVLNSKDLSFTVNDNTVSKCIFDTQVLQVDKTLSKEERENRCKILFVSLFSELMMKNITIAPTYPKWLSDFLVKLSHSDLSTTSIKNDLTIDSTYGYSQLIYLFKKHMGCTIKQYISHQRIERAKELLKYSDLKIIDIAATVGCDNVSHFNRIFKAATGMTPTQFRQSVSRFSNPKQEEGEEGRKEGRKEGTKERRNEGTEFPEFF